MRLIFTLGEFMALSAFVLFAKFKPFDDYISFTLVAEQLGKDGATAEYALRSSLSSLPSCSMHTVISPSEKA